MAHRLSRRLARLEVAHAAIHLNDFFVGLDASLAADVPRVRDALDEVQTQMAHWARTGRPPLGILRCSLAQSNFWLSSNSKARVPKFFAVGRLF
jgi:hypothetical protein